MNFNHLFINLTDPVLFQSFGGDEAWAKVDAAPGTKVFVEGDHSQDFYYVFSGILSVDKALKDGVNKKKHLATLTAGDFFGEGALLSDKSRAATVTATTDSVLLKLSQANFESLVMKDPQAAVGILLGIVKVLNARLQDTNERLVVLHHVAELVRAHGGDHNAMLATVFKELEAVTHHGMLALFSNDDEAVLKTDATDYPFLETLAQNLPRIALFFDQPGAPESYVDGNRLYLVLRNSEGVRSGILGAQACMACQEEDTRLLLTIAEQIGHLI